MLHCSTKEIALYQEPNYLQKMQMPCGADPDYELVFGSGEARHNKTELGAEKTISCEDSPMPAALRWAF